MRRRRSVITAERIRRCRSTADTVELLRELGYPVDPVSIDPAEWRRSGIRISWNGEVSLSLLSRLARFDLFLVEGKVASDEIAEFLRSCAQHNVFTKSVIINYKEEQITVFDIDLRSRLRRLVVSTSRPTPHALDRLNLLALSGSDCDAARIFDRALDRESVTRQFFVRFRTAVRDVAAELAQRHGRDEADAHALLILSRLLFLSFIQEKGWLNGERRFLVDRLERAHVDRREFFATVLLPLFFGCLNTPAAERSFDARELGRIPYLNGGLFEPSPFERRTPELHLSNELMRSVLEEVFEKFDFSVDESDTAGTHVDPEMLGKVFESLMAADERAASGSFYTPKEIVDVLTTRAIAEWLSDHDGALRADIESLIAGAPVPPTVALSAPQLIEKLRSISVLDPACGSGAFLLSALGVIERLLRALGDDGPELRQQIVSRSLYGVDLKPEAVRLCELRLWLSIVSRADATIETVVPLPNLDRNILQGNALLGPADFLGTARGDIYRDWAFGLRAQRDLIERYRNAPRGERPALFRMIRDNDVRLAADLLSRAIDSDERELAIASAPSRDLFGDRPPDLDRCRELQGQIAAQRRTLDGVESGLLDFFSFDIHFAPVMAAGGFDVVLGNPPWVRASKIDRETRVKLRDRFAFFRSPGSSAFHQPDLSLAFFERAAALAAPGGVVSLLMPSKIANAAYAVQLRRFAAERMSITDLVDWSSEARRHFTADTFPLGIVLRKRADMSCAQGGRINVSAEGETFVVGRSDLTNCREWQLIHPRVAAILNRLRGCNETAEMVLGRRPVMGVKTGNNGGFFLDIVTVKTGHVVTRDGLDVPFDAVCRCVRGRDLRRWQTMASHWMLWPPASGWRGTPDWLRELAGARGIEPRALKLAYVRPEHAGIKVAWKDVSRGMAAAVLPDVVDVDGRAFPLIPNQTLYSIDAVSFDEAYVLAALLNSTVAGALLFAIAERAKDDHFRYFGRTVGSIPLPRITPADPYWDKLVRLSRAAHRSGEAAADLDAIVAILYGISAGELETLRAFVARRSGAR
ncbi:MAG TPA: N-6 DNA methylase [Thermoanaerobaculia bacterium]|nr:N-6 DNA methylase [Thermoanaerobaculia bacterium]